MPSSVIRHGASQVPPGLIPQLPATYRPNDILIHPMSHCAMGDELTSVSNTSFASTAYPAANRAIGFMFCIADYFNVMKVWWVNGTTATTDNADVGVYTEAGTTLLVSGGSTAIATANVVQEKDCTDTLLPPGRYWCVFNQSGTTATTMASAVSIGNLRMMGAAQFAGAIPLGGTFTPAACAAAVMPYFGIAGRTQVA